MDLVGFDSYGSALGSRSKKVKIEMVIGEDVDINS